MKYAGMTAKLVAGFVQEVPTNPSPHFHPRAITEMEHLSGISFPPIFPAVGGGVPDPNVSVLVLGSLIADPDPKGGEVGHLQTGLPVQFLNLCVDPFHVLIMIEKI